MTALVQGVKPDGARVRAGDLLRAVRPQQWVKNVLVVSAPAAAGVLFRGHVLLSTLMAVLAVTVTASACYLINDVVDRDLDTRHPRKRLRPIASGAVPVRIAAAAAGALLGLGLLLAALVSAGVLLVVGAYFVLMVLYAVRLKHVPWVEMAVVASGFVLRAVAGAVAAGVYASPAFLLVVTAAAVHLVASKRASELFDRCQDSRPVLRAYTAESLRALRLLSAALLLLGYAGWALVRSGTLETVLAAVSVLPVALVLARWMWRTDRGETGAPEEVLVSDPLIRCGVAAWALFFTGAVFAAVWGA
jgi:decaprenyl-phosphate phosphoribosyltransferase